MAFTLTQTQSQVLTVFRSYLMALTGYTTVIQGQSNRVPAPKVSDYIVFTPINRTRLATNTTVYNSSNGGLLNQHTNTQSTQLNVQVDCYGPNSADTIQILSTEFRSSDAVDYFAGAIADVAPLYTSDPRQLPFSDEADQVQMRWSCDCALQFNPGVTSPQDFADSLSVGIIDVDAEWPPT